MKKVEVVYVRSGYTPMRAPKVSPNFPKCARRRFFTRADVLAKECQEVSVQVAARIEHVRSIFRKRVQQEEKEIQRLVAELAKVKAELSKAVVK